MSCEIFKYSGTGDCDALRDSIRGVMLTDKGTTITRANAGILGLDSTGWASILAPLIATSPFVKGTMIDLGRGYEVTTPEAEMTTSNVNVTDQTSTPLPQMTGHAKMGYADYMTFFGANGKTFDIVLVSEDGNPIMTKSATGIYKGFRGRIFIKEGNIPKAGADKTKECEFKFMFEDAKEWKNIIEVKTDFSFTELYDTTPAGLDVEVTTDYSSPTVTIKAARRGTGLPYIGLDALGVGIQIIDAPNDPVAAVASVNITNSATGSYALTLTASLNGPVRAQLTAETTKRTYLSNVFYLVE